MVRALDGGQLRAKGRPIYGEEFGRHGLEGHRRRQGSPHSVPRPDRALVLRSQFARTGGFLPRFGLRCNMKREGRVVHVKLRLSE
jgi:hypothetical protein